MENYKSIGVKLTPQRLEIFKYLEGNTSHPSALDVYRAVLEKFPTISFATVYNTLIMLKEKGLVHELFLDPDKKRFDYNMEPHNHLICVKCKTIIDIFSDFSVSLPDKDCFGFQIIANHIDFYGICPSCQKQDNLSNDVNNSTKRR